MKKLPLKRHLLALALLPVLLAACGGGSDDNNANNPADPGRTPGDGTTQGIKPGRPIQPNSGVTPPGDTEQSAFTTSKISIVRLGLAPDQAPAPFLITVNGVPTRGFDGENAQRDFSKLPSGFASLKGSLTLVKKDNNQGNNGNNSANPGTNPSTPTPPATKPGSNSKDKDTATPVTLRSYQGLRSGVVVGYYDDTGRVVSSDIYGVSTAANQIPTSGKATYTGTAFDRNERGTLIYDVNFAERRGDGRIEGISRYGMITLNNANITNIDGEIGVTGSAQNLYRQPLRYEAIFHGYNAEELTGTVEHTTSKDVIGFHGTRGEIVK